MNTEVLRPLCYCCDSLAVALIARKATPKATWFPVCESHDPDPEEYGNKTTWSDKVTIRRYDDPISDYDVFGRLGGENYKGRIIHIENPAGDGILCDKSADSQKRYNLSIGYPDDAVICGKCSSTSNWRENYSEDIVGGFLFELRSVLDDFDQLNRFAGRKIEYPQPDPRTSHRIAEGML